MKTQEPEDAPELETVQDYIQRIMKEKGIDPEEIAAKVKKRKLKLSAGYIGNLAYGAAANPSIQRAKALAYGLGEPEEEVFAVLRGVPVPRCEGFRETFFHSLWETYSQLSNEDKTRFDGTLNMLRDSMREAAKSRRRDRS